MRKIEHIVIHESDTPTGRPTTVKDIDLWHRQRGFQRKEEARLRFNQGLTSIGYHYVIYLDGSVHSGRDEEEVPAAVVGYNSTSINICLVGKGVYTHPQWAALGDLVTDLKNRFPRAAIKGHCEFNTAAGKTCPDFDVQAWIAAGMVPPAGHITEVQ